MSDKTYEYKYDDGAIPAQGQSIAGQMFRDAIKRYETNTDPSLRDAFSRGITTEKLRGTDDISKGGVKFDAGKPRLELLPPDALLGLAAVLTFGAKKYEARNWEKGMDWSRPYAAALRHLFAWHNGEELDPDTGLSHLDHALCNLVFLSAYTKRKVGIDDRPK